MVTMTRFLHYGNWKWDNDKVTGMSHEPVQKLIILLLELETLMTLKCYLLKRFSERICVSEYLNLKRCICIWTQKRICEKKEPKNNKNNRGELNQLHTKRQQQQVVSPQKYTAIGQAEVSTRKTGLQNWRKTSKNAILYGVSMETERVREGGNGSGSGHWSC